MTVGARAPSRVLLLFLFTFALAQSAPAEWQVAWKRIAVDAHLDNNGALHVTERMFVTLAGNVNSLERKIAAATDQEILLRRLAREEDGAEREFAGDGFDEKWRFMWRDNTLTWWIRENADPPWAGQTVAFRLEYELRNALAPAWDIAPGPNRFRYSPHRFSHFSNRFRSTILSWRDVPRTFDRRFRLEHDVLFPDFPASGPEELNYTLRYDTAWRRVHPDTDIGQGTDIDYRVTQLLDYLRPGWPPAIELWRPITRVGSIFALLVLTLLLWGIFAVGIIRRFGLLPPRLNRRWFEEKIAAHPPEILACVLGKPRAASCVAPFLARLRARGLISVRTDPPANEESDPLIRLELLREDRTLQPYEQQMIRALFPRGATSGSDVLAQHYAKTGFQPETVFMEALDEHRPEIERFGKSEPARRSLFWNVLRRLAPILVWSAVVLLLVDLFYDERPMGLIFTSFGLALLVAGLPQLIFPFETPLSGGLAALVTVLAVVAAILAVLALHFFENLPLSPRGSVGLALFAFWCVIALLCCAQTDGSSPSVGAKRTAFLGARFARKELRKSHPALDDAWMPHLSVLGLDEKVNAWRKRRASEGAGHFPLPPGAVGAFGAVTGSVPFAAEQAWADALVVYAEEEEGEAEDEEGEDGEDGEDGKET